MPAFRAVAGKEPPGRGGDQAGPLSRQKLTSAGDYLDGHAPGEPLAGRQDRRRGHRVAGSAATAGETHLIDLPMYQIDALVRRAPSLQKTREGRTPAATY